MKKNKEQIIKLNKSFYTLNSIKATINAFEGICDAKVKEDKKKFLIYLVPKESDLNLLSFEFANYALGLMR
tara:strand:+ start:170 stop:382 length:213 start_codon:yes stop_codon:yes gene_type:complete